MTVPSDPVPPEPVPSEPVELAMFPLGSVLWPYTLVPLHVFEPRYRELVETCLAGTNEFGVVLIERGHEVGGGDKRFDVGTVARILRADRLEDGRYVLVVGGTQRLRVEAWLPDDPYPRATVRRLGEGPGSPDPARVAEVVELAARVVALRAILGESMPTPTGDLATDDDPVRACFRAAAAAGLGPLDAQRVLELDDPGARADRLAERLAEVVEVLEFRLGGPSSPPPGART
jgi:Lon protease-like protein